jgi:hypothetical protein
MGIFVAVSLTIVTLMLLTWLCTAAWYDINRVAPLKRRVDLGEHREDRLRGAIVAAERQRDIARTQRDDYAKLLSDALDQRDGARKERDVLLARLNGVKTCVAGYMGSET